MPSSMYDTGVRTVTNHLANVAAGGSVEATRIRHHVGLGLKTVRLMMQISTLRE